MSPIFQDASSSKISSAVPTFGGESRKFFEQPFVFTTAFHARLCCTLLGGTGGGWWRVSRILREPRFRCPHRSFKTNLWGTPSAEPPCAGVETPR